LSVAGGLCGAVAVAFVEATRAVSAAQVPLGAVAMGDLAVLAPIATAVGLAVAVAGMLLDPHRRWSFRAAIADVAKLEGGERARAAALALVLPFATLAWAVACAHAARQAMTHGPAAEAGVEVAAASIVMLLFTGASVLGVVPATARTLAAHVSPLVAATCGATYALSFATIGVRLGDESGSGATPLAILGVLTRPELDLSPAVAAVVIAVCALIGERASRAHRWGRVGVALAAVVAAWSLVLTEARALSVDPSIASAIERTAPLGRIGLALARRATDRDHDGASALFGGGDCDDTDPTRYPLAVDVPGNGIDEDCSGADLPLPHPGPPAPPPRPPGAFPPDLDLVLITVDTLRIDLGFMGYARPVSPSLDALAERSTVFERAYSMASYTGKSLGPTMIGKYPSECLRDGAHFDTYLPGNTFLAERFHAAGIHTMGAAPHWYFKPRYGLGQGMDVWDLSAMPPESGGDTDSSVTSARLTDAAIRLLSDPANTQGRFFLWVHYFDPHANYVSHAEAPDFRPGAKSWAKPLYDGEVWFTDHHLGRLFDFIESQPWGRKTAIFLTADHGEAFDEHGMNWHGVDLWEPLVRVPLLAYVPGVKPHRVAEKRSLIDLAPTLLDVMGIPQPAAGELSGQSNSAAIALPDEAVEERDVYIDMPAGPQVSQHRAFIHGDTPGLKLMSEGGPLYLLFDLARDPSELNDLSRDRALLDRMKSAYEDKVAGLHTMRVSPAAGGGEGR
jgi:arylsulfatase A-like enzyme